MECEHKSFKTHHRGEALDTMLCLLCGTTWDAFYGPNQVGSICFFPNSQRPPGSQVFWVDDNGNRILAPDADPPEQIPDDGAPA